MSVTADLEVQQNKVSRNGCAQYPGVQPFVSDFQINDVFFKKVILSHIRLEFCACLCKNVHVVNEEIFHKVSRKRNDIFDKEFR